jgi:hypothetical protein
MISRVALMKITSCCLSRRSSIPRKKKICCSGAPSGERSRLWEQGAGARIWTHLHPVLEVQIRLGFRNMSNFTLQAGFVLVFFVYLRTNHSNCFPWSRVESRSRGKRLELSVTCDTRTRDERMWIRTRKVKQFQAICGTIWRSLSGRTS